MLEASCLSLQSWSDDVVRTACNQHNTIMELAILLQKLQRPQVCMTQCTRCRRSLDLGQFERFRRIMHTPYFSVLLSHTHSKLVSDLQVSTCLHSPPFCGSSRQLSSDKKPAASGHTQDANVDAKAARLPVPSQTHLELRQHLI